MAGIAGVFSLEFFEACRARLRPGGIMLANLLREPGQPWSQLKDPVKSRYPFVVEILFESYQNHFVIGFPKSVSPREIGRQIREKLDAIGSRQAREIQVRTLKG